MKKIKNLEIITAVNSKWKPSDLAFIKSLEWTINGLLIHFYCQIRENVTGWPDISKEFFEISIMFENASAIKLDFAGLTLHQVTGFNIIDISDNGWESINFQIEDYENGSISFYCEDINIEFVSIPALIDFA